MLGALSAGEFGTLAQAGGMLAGTSGLVAGGLLSVLADVALGVSSRNRTPAGVASIRADLASGGFLPAALGLDVYAASSKKEYPADLLRAAVKRFVEEVAKKEAEAKKEAGVKEGADEKQTPAQEALNAQ